MRRRLRGCWTARSSSRCRCFSVRIPGRRTVSGWIAEVNATRAAALASSATGRARAIPQGRLSEEAITLMIQALGDIRKVIENAAIEDKARVYDQLGLRLTYAPGAKTVRVEMNLNPNRGVMVVSEGGSIP